MNDLACPDPTCTGTYDCEACLNDHLRATHNVRYSDVFGELRDGWTTFCTGHAGQVVATL